MEAHTQVEAVMAQERAKADAIMQAHAHAQAMAAVHAHTAKHRAALRRKKNNFDNAKGGDGKNSNSSSVVGTDTLEKVKSGAVSQSPIANL